MQNDEEKEAQVVPNVKPNCLKCGYHLMGSSGKCYVCAYIEKRKEEIHCIVCSKDKCQAHCSMCGSGIHTRCAKKRRIKIDSKDASFSCSACSRDDVNTEIECGECRGSFATGEEELRGFRLKQDIVVEKNERLYTCKIVDVRHQDESLRLHFLGWNSRFDEWVSCDDESLNESMACDACANWLHIECLPPLPQGGRSKDLRFVCNECYYEAEARYEFDENGRKIRAKPKKHKAIRRISDLSLQSSPKRKKATVEQKERMKRSESMTNLGKELLGQESEEDTKAESGKVTLLHVSEKPSTMNESRNFETSTDDVTIKQSQPTTQPQSLQEKSTVAVMHRASIKWEKVLDSPKKPCAFDILREVACQSMSYLEETESLRSGNGSSTPPVLIDTDLDSVRDSEHEECFDQSEGADDSNFLLRQEMYLEFCELEKGGLIPETTAQELRSFTHPTSKRFRDVKFLYLVNKGLSRPVLGKRLAEMCTS